MGWLLINELGSKGIVLIMMSIWSLQGLTIICMQLIQTLSFFLHIVPSLNYNVYMINNNDDKICQLLLEGCI